MRVFVLYSGLQPEHLHLIKRQPGVELFLHSETLDWHALARLTPHFSLGKPPADETRRRKYIWSEFERLCDPTEDDFVLFMYSGEMLAGDILSIASYMKATGASGFQIPVGEVSYSGAHWMVSRMHEEARIFAWHEKAGFSKKKAHGPKTGYGKVVNYIKCARILNFCGEVTDDCFPWLGESNKIISR